MISRTCLVYPHSVRVPAAAARATGRRVIALFATVVVLFLSAAADGKEAAPDRGATPNVDPRTGALVDDAPDAAEPPAEDRAHVLLGGRGERSVGGWGGLGTQVTSVNGSPAQLVGFGGGVMLDHAVTLGFAGFGIATSVEADQALFKARGSGTSNDAPHFIEGGYGGLLVGVEPWSYSLFHPSFQGIFGAGALTYSQRQYEDGWDESWDIDSTICTEDERPVGLFRVAELTAGLTVNVARWCRADVNAGYRWVGGLTEFEGVTSAELAGSSLAAGVRFGRF